MVVVALGSPNVPVTTCAEALPPAKELETAKAPKASFLIHARKSIRRLLAGTAALASQGDSCEGVRSAATERRTSALSKSTPRFGLRGKNFSRSPTGNQSLNLTTELIYRFVTHQGVIPERRATRSWSSQIEIENSRVPRLSRLR